VRFPEAFTSLEVDEARAAVITYFHPSTDPPRSIMCAISIAVMDDLIACGMSRLPRICLYQKISMKGGRNLVLLIKKKLRGL
jgi:hypothetical protein